MTKKDFLGIADTIPVLPGIYKYFDVDGQILYVGKAKHLRKRVSSYFSKQAVNQKTLELVHKIHTIEFTIVNSEHDALLLENALIKQYQPRYNISLKDGKTYPFIVIKNESFPRVILTRKKINDGSIYLGPFTSPSRVHELMEFVKTYIPLRTCKLLLTDKNIAAKKFKVCLEYHLGNCKGPCEGLQSGTDYDYHLQMVKKLLSGNTKEVIASFKKEMIESAKNFNYEKAEVFRKKITSLENYQSQSVIVSNGFMTVDVFSIVKEEESAFVNYLMVEHGTIIQTHTVALVSKLEEPEVDLLSYAVDSIRETFNSKATEIVVPFSIRITDKSVKVTVPKTGNKKSLLDLSLKNAAYFKDELKRKKTLNLQQKTIDDHIKILHELKDKLKLSTLPLHIECFDNSHFQGSFPVSAMVCFKNGIPDKKEYRHYHVKTVKGIDDFATMKEVVYRRYKRLMNEGKEMPDLVIIDGGKGQLSAALESIQILGLTGRFTLIGLAKNEEEIFFAGDQSSIRLDMDSNGLTLIRLIRDEVHNTVINFHRNLRSKAAIQTGLENIKGIGKSTIDLLLKQFKSIQSIQQLPEEKVRKLIGAKKTKLVMDYLDNKKKGSG